MTVVDRGRRRRQSKWRRCPRRRIIIGAARRSSGSPTRIGRPDGRFEGPRYSGTVVHFFYRNNYLKYDKLPLVMEDTSLKSRDDRELVASYLRGEEEVLTYLIDRHIKSIYRFVYTLVGDESTAEDLTQDVFVKVWKKLRSYNNKYSFKTWLFTIARNTTFDYLRKKKEIVFSEFENESGDNTLADTLADELPLAEEIFSKAEDAKVFAEAFKKLKPLYREILVLRYTDDLSIEEISKILKRPVETVKSQHRRGLLHLKELLPRIY